MDLQNVNSEDSLALPCIKDTTSDEQSPESTSASDNSSYDDLFDWLPSFANRTYNPVLIEKSKMRCCYCGRRFDSNRNRHLLEHVKKRSHFECPILWCPKRFKSFRDISFHLNYEHRLKEVNNKEKCKECLNEYGSSTVILIHYFLGHLRPREDALRMRKVEEIANEIVPRIQLVECASSSNIWAQLSQSVSPTPSSTPNTVSNASTPGLSRGSLESPMKPDGFHNLFGIGRNSL